MTTQTLTLYWPEQIDCVDCPSSVALCVPSSIIESTLDDPYYITAELTNQCYVDVGCGTAKWKLTLTYDDVQIVSGSVLTASLVYGIVCLNDCLLKVVQQLIAEALAIP